jgi:hypothetical protein
MPIIAKASRRMAGPSGGLNKVPLEERRAYSDPNSTRLSSKGHTT